MSMSYSSLSYIVDLSSLPSKFESTDLFENYIGQFSDGLYGSTRNGWMHWVLDEVVKAYKIGSIDFLGLDRGDFKLDKIDEEYCSDGPFGYYFVSVLSGERLSGVVDGITCLVDNSISDTSKIGEIMKDYDDIPGIVEAARDSEILESPYFSHGDEGEGARYFFAYLRAFKNVCETALSQGAAVVYVLDSPA